jgi:hypothetical protein
MMEASALQRRVRARSAPRQGGIVSSQEDVMTFEDFEKANPEKLREEARSCFDKAEANPSWGGAPTLLLQAQFLMM